MHIHDLVSRDNYLTDFARFLDTFVGQLEGERERMVGLAALARSCHSANFPTGSTVHPANQEVLGAADDPGAFGEQEKAA